MARLRRFNVHQQLDIHLRSGGCDFIPAHTILQRSGTELAIPVQHRRLLPDQLFAVRYPDGYRAFLLEVDRSTEPLRFSAATKSLVNSVDLYREVFANNLRRRHYGINASTLVAWVFTNRLRAQNFHAVVQERAGQFAGHFLTKTMPEALTWGNLTQLHQCPWTSGSGTEVVGL